MQIGESEEVRIALNTLAITGEKGCRQGWGRGELMALQIGGEKNNAQQKYHLYDNNQAVE